MLTLNTIAQQGAHIMKNLIDVTTETGRGQFKRHLRKLNAADRNLEKSHKMTFSDRYCDMKRCKKWRSIRNKILSQVSFPKIEPPT